ncbi:3',5'-cyclic AMP phosphodiesterase CpdA [Paenibacillus sp. UNCCL117]|uniref:metallophosphoesterase family protein n=1 Tax=unclassified Paenibacillus TaxID=185978 RepID=UPI00088873FA|nr:MULTISPECIES: metallophosphoesterase [unclassified Paenibacillus]SDD51602.1 3',5'-cyclic AMP phosphodiesterase CpdA [Paenibacillus sp. cl123]SFW49476.1 3',5'-cyclic AMP phosphodiesterase CpdA [Paenibacillus sp. UNCCL117]
MSGNGAKIRFGLMADVHQDFMYKAEERLAEFVDHMNRERADFIVQLGDFCYPKPENKHFVSIWERFAGPAYHVLGNHDMDRCGKQEMMDYLGMPRNYYSFDSGDYHFVVLDTNYLNLEDGYADYAHGNYHKHPKHIGNVTPEQLDWLKGDLAATGKSTIIFSHQNLESVHLGFNIGIQNSDELLAVLREANAEAGFRKVVACMNGHSHLDGVKVIDDIYFIHINSMSYFYMGKDYERVRYSEEITESHPLLARTAPYREGLYALVTLEPGVLTIEGRETAYVGPPPLECGHSNSNAGHILSAKISSRRLLF